MAIFGFKFYFILFQISSIYYALEELIKKWKIGDFKWFYHILNQILDILVQYFDLHTHLYHVLKYVDFCGGYFRLRVLFGFVYRYV